MGAPGCAHKTIRSGPITRQWMASRAWSGGLVLRPDSPQKGRVSTRRRGCVALRVTGKGSLRVSGLVREILGAIVFLAFGVFLYFDARKKATHYQVVGIMIALLAFFMFYTIYTWKFIGF